VTVTLIHLGIADGANDIVGQFADGEDLPVAALEARVFISGDHNGSITTIAGDHNGLGQGDILVAANFLAELSRGYADHVIHSNLPDIP
jgi:hypothetical protein